MDGLFMGYRWVWNDFVGALGICMDMEGDIDGCAIPPSATQVAVGIQSPSGRGLSLPT